MTYYAPLKPQQQPVIVCANDNDAEEAELEAICMELKVKRMIKQLMEKYL